MSPLVGLCDADAERLADEALRAGRPVMSGGYAFVPDVVALEGEANGEEMPDTATLRRHDGRTVRVYRLPRGVRQ